MYEWYFSQSFIGVTGIAHTKQKFHSIFGVNYVGHWLLTYLLLDILKKSAPSRVVNVASTRHYYAKEMDLTEMGENGIKFPFLSAYKHSKLGNVLHAKELARRLKGT